MMTARFGIFGNFLYYWPITSFFLFFSLSLSWFIGILIIYWSLRCTCSFTKKKNLFYVKSNNSSVSDHAELIPATSGEIFLKRNNEDNANCSRTLAVSGRFVPPLSTSFQTNNSAFNVSPKKQQGQHEKMVRAVDSVTVTNYLLSGRLPYEEPTVISSVPSATVEHCRYASDKVAFLIIFGSLKNCIYF